MPGPYWKLIVFREAHVSSPFKAHSLATTMRDRLYKTCPFHSLDLAAATTWLERKMNGRISEQSEGWLTLFDSLKAYGKKDLLTLQGFLLPSGSGVQNKKVSSGSILRSESAYADGSEKGA
jgi:hypothetical protein